MDILTMNQSIFSNKSKEMYVPTNAVEMTYDEMECVDGGAWLVTTIEWTLNMELFAANAAINTARIFGKKAVYNFVKKKLGSWVSYTLMALSLGNLVGTAVKGVNMLLDFGPDRIMRLLSVGGLVATAFDLMDGNWDGMVFGQ